MLDPALLPEMLLVAENGKRCGVEYQDILTRRGLLIAVPCHPLTYGPAHHHLIMVLRATHTRGMILGLLHLLEVGFLDLRC